MMRNADFHERNGLILVLVMAYVTSRKNTNNEILLLFPIPFYTSSRIYYEEDLEQLGLDRVLDDVALTCGARSSIMPGTLSNVQRNWLSTFSSSFPSSCREFRVEDLGNGQALLLTLMTPTV